jgi:hypothetical protein
VVCDKTEAIVEMLELRRETFGLNSREEAGERREVTLVRNW